MPAPHFVIIPKQRFVTETSDEVSSERSFPIEWAIKLSIGKDFLAEFASRDDRVRAYVSFGIRRYYWNVVGRLGETFQMVADGHTRDAVQAMQEATDAAHRARVVIDERERAERLKLAS